MKNIDKFILDLYQDTADLIQKVFGIDNFTLAKAALIITLVSNIFYNWILHTGSKFSLLLILSCCGLFIFFVSLLIVYLIILSIERSMRKNSDILYKNKAEENFRTFRYIQLFFLCLSVFNDLVTIFGIHTTNEPQKENFVSYIDLISIFSFLSCIYFACCTPKPPTKSKITELLEKLGRMFHQEPEPSGI